MQVREHFAVDVPVTVDATAAPAQSERRLEALAGLERLEPRLEIAGCTGDVDPTVPDVLDRHDVVVVCDRLQPDDPAQGPVEQVLGHDGHCSLLHLHLLLLGRLSEPEAQAPSLVDEVNRRRRRASIHGRAACG
jgi:hypothetical protein